MYLGLDLGTSSVKAMLIDNAQQVIGVGHAGLTVQNVFHMWRVWLHGDDDVGALGPSAVGPGVGVAGFGFHQSDENGVGCEVETCYQCNHSITSLRN